MSVIQIESPKHQFIYSNNTINVYHADKGEGLVNHFHTFNHATMCHSGSCIVRVKGKEIVMNKNSQPIDLPKNEWHEIESLEENTVFVNIFPTEGTYQGE